MQGQSQYQNVSEHNAPQNLVRKYSANHLNTNNNTNNKNDPTLNGALFISRKNQHLHGNTNGSNSNMNISAVQKPMKEEMESGK